jgi:hypothetical protein
MPIEIILNDKLIQTVKKFVWKRLSNQCWIWTGGRSKEGYGRVTIRNDQYGTVSYMAHRVMYVIEYGSFDWNLHVNHDCDNPPCCNPNHLWLGTQQDGINDCINKGRKAIGENNPAAKITREIANKIRFKASLGISQRDLAREFGLHQTTIGDIINYKLWI